MTLQLGESALSGTMFVFRNRTRTGLKLLMWSHGGFVLIYKKLESGRFGLPEATSPGRAALSPAETAAILEGIDLRQARRLPRWEPVVSP